MQINIYRSQAGISFVKSSLIVGSGKNELDSTTLSNLHWDRDEKVLIVKTASVKSARNASWGTHENCDVPRLRFGDIMLLLIVSCKNGNLRMISTS